uniref:Uncharacterized protein n=1 Tax=Heliothis virescens TaxID=7102 RepID=A0A2A4J517_HELVI
MDLLASIMVGVLVFMFIYLFWLWFCFGNCVRNRGARSTGTQESISDVENNVEDSDDDERYSSEKVPDDDDN